MSRYRYALFVALFLCACRQVLGLDDLREKSATADLPDTGTDGSPAPTEAGSACATTAECTADAGRPSLCVEKRCVAIKQELCPPDAVLPGPEILQDENALLFAAFVPFTDGHPSSSSEGPRRAFELAVSEIYAIPGSPSRRVGLLLCDGSFTEVQKSVEHVVQDIRVPGVIAGFQPKDLTLFAQNYFAAKTTTGDFAHPVFVVNPNPPAAQMRYIKDQVGGLVMNLLGPVEDLAATYTPLLAKAETYLSGADSFRGIQKITPGEMRVALVHEKGEPYYDELADTLREGPFKTTPAGLVRDGTRALRFDNASLAENKAAARFEDITITGTPNYDEVAAKLAAFKPDVVIALTIQQVDFSNNEFKGLVPRVEKELLGKNPAPPMPLWILRNARHIVPYLEQLRSASGQQQLQRFIGVTYGAAVDGAEERTKWLNRMGTQFDASTANDWSWTENFYDAVYWLVYGYYAAKSTGTQLAEGVAISKAIQGKMLPTSAQPPVVRPGETAVVPSQFEIIKNNDEVMFRGALGDSKIPFATMTWESVGSVYCFWINGFDVDIRYDHLRYNRTDGTLYTPLYDGGSPSCF